MIKACQSEQKQMTNVSLKNPSEAQKETIKLPSAKLFILKSFLWTGHQYLSANNLIIILTQAS